MAGAHRLARFNAIDFTGFYVGVPITIAGTLLGASIFLLSYIPAIAFIFITLILSYLMISKLKIKKT
jgi:CDP-diacylglycerol--serine O-phosphatidyltransferase